MLPMPLRAPGDFMMADMSRAEFESLLSYDPWLENRKANGEEFAQGLICRCASEIVIEPIEWLWPGRIAIGKHTCIAGEPGTGKSQLTMAIVATITMGGEWPCKEGRAPQGSVIILSAEDGAADTIVPRLHAAGADLGRVQIVSAVRERDGKGRRAFSLQADLELLEKEIERIGDVALVVIDPVSSYLGQADSHKNAEVRGVLEPIGEMAERMRVAILSVTHFNKMGAGTSAKALHRFIGSIAFVGAPRMAFAVVEDADKDRRLFLHTKNNLAAPPQGLAFQLKQKIVGAGKGIVASFVEWEQEHVPITANEALATEVGYGDSHGAKEEAVSFLQEVLSGGPVWSREVRRQAEEAGIATRTLMRAKGSLGIESSRDCGASEKPKWLWKLRKDANHDPRVPRQNVGILGTLGAENGAKDAKDANFLNGTLAEQIGTDGFPELPAFLDRRGQVNDTPTAPIVRSLGQMQEGQKDPCNG
jgi:putative DNA primase/helicase